MQAFSLAAPVGHHRDVTTTARALVLAAIAVLAACSDLAGDGAPMPGECRDRTPRLWDNTLEGTATIARVSGEGEARTLTFDFRANNWTAPERQAPVLARNVAGLAADLELAEGRALGVRAVFHLSQVCATTPTEAEPPTWTSLGAPPSE